MSLAAITLIANLIVIISAIIILCLWIPKWIANYQDNKHLLFMKLEYFRTNHIPFLVRFRHCPETAKTSDDLMGLVESIRSDPKKWGIIRTKHTDTYDFMRKLVALNREIKCPSLRIVSFKDTFQ